MYCLFFFSSRRRHTRFDCDWSSGVLFRSICADEAIGTFTVAARRPRAFGKEKREMLSVLANHVAVSLANARLYGRMEEMATTDGLTGLINHRAFQERFAEMLARAERTAGKHA